MREITAYRTRDGQLFDSHMCAKSHADKRYSDALTKLAHGAVKQEKYLAMSKFLEDNLAAFVELSALEKDRQLLKDLCQFPETEES